jgi:long-subunit fatty acid transport protein
MMWLLIVFVAPTNGQDDEWLRAREDIFYPAVEFGVGARAMGMGGAFMAVGEDYTASYWNPAALAQIRRFEVLGSLSRASAENTVSASGLSLTDDVSATNINSIGFAYPVPTYRGSLVFSVGYHRIAPYDAALRFSLDNDTADDSVQQRWSAIDEGGLSNWTFAGAVDVAPNFSLGVALNYWTGRHDQQFRFLEQDNRDLYTFTDSRHDDNITSEIRGFNLRLGALYRVNSQLRLAATIATPTSLTITDKFSIEEETRFDAGPADFFADDQESEYSIRSPFTFGAGAALNVAGLLLSGSAEFIDWQEIRFTSDEYIDWSRNRLSLDYPIAPLQKSQAREQIRNNYRSVTRLRAGAEFTFPGVGMQARAGYYLDPSPLDGLTKEADREFITYGLGILLNKQVKLDVAYFTGDYLMHNPLTDFSGARRFNNALYEFDVPGEYLDIGEKASVNKIVATLAFRL